MAFNSVGQYTPSHKPWDHVGTITPDIEIAEGKRPAGEFRPASWLPVQFWDKQYENWFVVMAGKLVAFDNDGNLVPAQYALCSNITYTADDVTAGTIDVTTGSAVTSAKTVLVSGVSTFMGRTEQISVSAPVGVAPYNYLQWCGGDGSDPTQYNQHNYNMQHLVAILCDAEIQMPLVPDSHAAEALTWGASVNNIATATALAHRPVAANTVRTPMVFAGTNAATLFVNQVDTHDDITQAGDWSLDDPELGVLYCFHATGSMAGTTVSYYHYETNAATVSKFACAVGNLRAGDFVRCDQNSNYRLDDEELPSHDTIGQVLKRQVVKNHSLLNLVETAYSPPLATDATGALPGYAGQLDQLPGSATGGVPANVHYAGAADTVVLINLIGR